MKQISKKQKELLASVGLLRDKRGTEEANYFVVNKTHGARAKSYYVMEENTILCFLGDFKLANVLEINQTQLAQLKKANLVTEQTIQYPNQYIKGANCYVTEDNLIYITKDYKLLSFLGVWTRKPRLPQE